MSFKSWEMHPRELTILGALGALGKSSVSILGSNFATRSCGDKSSAMETGDLESKQSSLLLGPPWGFGGGWRLGDLLLVWGLGLERGFVVALVALGTVLVFTIH